jgi:hypothetical protein
MKQNYLFLFLLIPIFNFANNTPILVTDSSISLNMGETQQLFYSFDKGDEIIFNLEMVKGRNIKEVEIVELPSKKVFSAFKADKIQNKTIKVPLMVILILIQGGNGKLLETLPILITLSTALQVTMK